MLNRKPAIRRAFKRAGGGNNGVQKEQLPQLLQGLVFFHNALDVFDALDVSGDHKLSLAELEAANDRLGLSMTKEQIASEFATLDKDNNGSLGLDEFVKFVEIHGIDA